MSIQIFTTGGTIDKTYFDARSEYEVGDPQIYDILREARVSADYEIETILRKDSLDLDDDDRALLRGHVARSESTRILVTHGTDTMVQTARTLHGLGDRTIVLVGSLSPARFKQSDAEFNIGFAMAAVQILPPGVYITMNGQIFDPDHVEKNREQNRFERV